MQLDLTEPVVILDLSHAVSLVRIDYQQVRDQILRVGRYIVPVLVEFVLARFDLVEQLGYVEVLRICLDALPEWYLTREELKKHHA